MLVLTGYREVIMSEILNELAIIDSVARTLRPLSKGEQRRVVSWLADYFDIYDDEAVAIESVSFGDADDEPVAEVVFETAAPEADDVEPEAEEPAPTTFEGLYELVAPKTAIQKIVTSAYWLETEEGEDSWTSFKANKLLKSLGVKISSVSGTLAIEGKKDDPKVEVLEKSGDSMQGRKTFRLSDAGREFVEDRLGLWEE